MNRLMNATKFFSPDAKEKVFHQLEIMILAVDVYLANRLPTFFFY